jgi:hypothetical protein
MRNDRRLDLTHDLVLPTLLFASLGAMTWAIRGCSGFGAMNGCVFAGVTWGAAWWFIARESSGQQSRRYASGWVILALTIGIGISGNRGWMQWPSFFEGHVQTNTAKGEFVPISRTYGFIWLFIAGVPWAGIGACLLAWCGPERPLRVRDWGLRFVCGLGAAFVARFLIQHFPEVFLPLYSSMKAQYADVLSNPNLGRLTNDCRAAIIHLGLYLGFLGYELGRRDWKNVVLILVVGLANGLGWALCQNWKWAAAIWPNVNFNWWRCWESCGGISIGIAYGIAYYLVNRSSSRRISAPQQQTGATPVLRDELFGAYSGLLLGLGLSIKNGLKGWANIYLGREEYYNRILWLILGPLLLVGLVALVFWIRSRPLSKDLRDNPFPHAYALIWLVMITQNVIAQLVTGPRAVWSEMGFSIYYVILFLLSMVILHHFHCVKPGA